MATPQRAIRRKPNARPSLPTKSLTRTTKSKSPSGAARRSTAMSPTRRSTTTSSPTSTVRKPMLWRQVKLVRHIIIDREKPLSQQQLDDLYVSHAPDDVVYADPIWFIQNSNVELGRDVTTHRKSNVLGAGYGLFTKEPIEIGTILLFEYDDSTGKHLGRRNINDRAFNLALLKVWVNVREEDLYQSWHRIVQRYIKAIPKKTNLIPMTFLDRHLKPFYPSYWGDKRPYVVTKSLKKGIELSVVYSVAVWVRLLRDVFPWKQSNLAAWRSIYREAADYASSAELRQEMLFLADVVSRRSRESTSHSTKR